MKYVLLLILLLNGAFIFCDNDMENITDILSKEQFKSIVQLILNNGGVALHSQLWGYSPYITFYRNHAIYLCPDLQSDKFKNPGGHPNFPHPKNKKEWYNVSNWTGMSINLGGITWANIYLIENNVYIGSIINMGKTGYGEHKNRLINIIIPQIKELLKE